MRVVATIASEQADTLIRAARQELERSQYSECVSLLQKARTVLLWLQSCPGVEGRLAQNVGNACTQVGEMLVEAELAFAQHKVRGVLQYAARLHSKVATSQQRPQSFAPVRKAVVAARAAYTRLLQEPWLPHRRRTLGRLKALDQNVVLKPPDVESEYHAAAELIQQAQKLLDANELERVRDATMEAAEILSMTDPAAEETVQGIMEVMEIEQCLARAQVAQAERTARRALLKDDVPTGLKACQEGRTVLNDLLEEAQRHGDEGSMEEMLQNAAELDQVQERLTAQRDLAGCTKKLNKALQTLAEAQQALEKNDAVMAEVLVARGQNVVTELRGKQAALLEALGKDKLDNAAAQVEALQQALQRFDSDAVTSEEEAAPDEGAPDDAAMDDLVKSINLTNKHNAPPK